MSKPLTAAAIALVALASTACSSLTQPEQFHVKKDTAVEEPEPEPAPVPAAPGAAGRPLPAPGKGG